MLSVAWAASIAANIGAALALRARHLRYPWFEAWLWACALGSVALVFSGPRTEWAYFWTFSLVDPLRWILLAAAIHEVFQEKMKGYRVLSWAGTVVLWGGILVAVFITALTLLFGSPGKAARAVQAFLMVKRLAWSAMLVFVCALLVFFRYYPAPSKRNLDHHLKIAALFLAGGALSATGTWSGGASVSTAYSLAGLVCTFGCYLAWALLMTRQGEASPEAASPERASIAEAAAERLLGGLKDAVRTARAAR